MVVIHMQWPAPGIAAFSCATKRAGTHLLLHKRGVSALRETDAVRVSGSGLTLGRAVAFAPAAGNVDLLAVGANARAKCLTQGVVSVLLYTSWTGPLALPESTTLNGIDTSISVGPGTFGVFPS